MMGFGFNNAYSQASKMADSQASKMAEVSVDALRGQAMQRLAGIERSLENKGVGAAFARASRAEPTGDTGFLGGLIADMALFAPVSAFFGDHFCGVMEGFNGVAAAGSIEGAIEGIAFLADQQASGYQNRRLNDYPEGRRKCALEAARTGRKFNLVSARDNNRFSFNAQAELACMFEILDMLDTLECQGVTLMRLDEQRPVYEALQQATQKSAAMDPVRSFAMPVRLTA